MTEQGDDDELGTLEGLPLLQAQSEEVGVDLDPDLAVILSSAPMGSGADLDLWERAGRVLRQRDSATYQMLRAWAVAYAVLHEPLTD